MTRQDDQKMLEEGVLHNSATEIMMLAAGLMIPGDRVVIGEDKEDKW